MSCIPVNCLQFFCVVYVRTYKFFVPLKLQPLCVLTQYTHPWPANWNPDISTALPFTKAVNGTLTRSYTYRNPYTVETHMSPLTPQMLFSQTDQQNFLNDNIWLPAWQRVDVIENEQGNRTTPSCVAFTDYDRLIGAPAVSQASKNPQNTIFQIKRLMGRDFEDENVKKQKKFWPFQIQKNSKGKPEVMVQFKREQKTFCPEEISAMILSKMKEVAETKLGIGKVKRAVVTVPAYFNDRQRQATKDAGKIAGLEVVRIINEPTAAAFAYGLDESVTNINGSQKVLVFDLGGGTFDVSILEIKNKEFKVLATGGDTNLGGEDFDDAIVKHCLKEFKKQHNSNIQQNTRAIRRLRTACERAKRDLSFQTETTIDVEMLCDGIDFTLQLSRARLENLLANYFNKCLDILKTVMDGAKLIKQDIDKVLMVGRSSRIPKLQKMLNKFFEENKLCKSIHPDEAVAQGAAIQGAILSGKGGQSVKDIIIQDVTPLSLGVAMYGDLMLTTIPKNTTVPCKKYKDVTTVFDFQTDMSIEIYQGERPLAKDNQFLSKFVLGGIQSDLKGKTFAVLTYEIDNDGILSVTAEERGREYNNEKISLTREQLALESHEIERMIQTAQQFQQEDEKERQRIIAKLKLKDMLDNLENETFAFSIFSGIQQDILDSQSRWLSNNETASREQLQTKIDELQRLFYGVGR